MQAEGVADLAQLLFPGLEQPEPDEAALPAPGRRLGQRHRALLAPAAVLIVSTVNDHVREPPCWQPGLIPVTQHGRIRAGDEDRTRYSPPSARAQRNGRRGSPTRPWVRR